MAIWGVFGSITAFSGWLWISGTLQVSSAMICSGNVSIAGTLTLDSALNFLHLSTTMIQAFPPANVNMLIMTLSGQKIGVPFIVLSAGA